MDTPESPKIRKRAASSATAEDIVDKERKEVTIRPDDPLKKTPQCYESITYQTLPKPETFLQYRFHRPQDSLFTSSSGYTNYRGLLNLCIILLLLSNCRVALENIIKYGILVDPIGVLKVFMQRPSQSPSLVIILGVYGITSLALLIEILIVKGLLKPALGVKVAIANLGLLLTLPAIYVYVKDCHPVGGSLALAITSIMFLKLVSYHMVNHWCRKDKLYSRPRSSTLDYKALNGKESTPEAPLVDYPDNLNIRDFVYYLCVPTLCYELNFPRTNRIRKRFLIKRLVEACCLMALIPALIQQWMIPIIQNSVNPFQEMAWSKLLERLLKLAVPNHVIWLIGFYGLFHSYFNVVGELLMFADRQFYKDWWNAMSVEQFWKTWNIPVHRWCRRHIFLPLLNHGVSKFMASVIVFFISALFHEYLVSIPLKMFRIWSFMGMVLQIPFAFVVKKYFRNEYANIAVWISLIIGQPLAILMYYHDYYVINYLK